MAEYTAEVLWQRGEQDFLGDRYSRRHLIRFDGGAEVVGSSSPHVVPLPLSDPAGVDRGLHAGLDPVGADRHEHRLEPRSAPDTDPPQHRYPGREGAPDADERP